MQKLFTKLLISLQCTQIYKSENAVGINYPGINLIRICKVYMNTITFVEGQKRRYE